MQLVLEFGSPQLGPVIAALNSILGSAPYDVGVQTGAEIDWVPSDETLDSAAAKLRDGRIFSMSIDVENPDIRYMLVLPPTPNSRSFWMGTVEYVGCQYLGIWSLLVHVEGLQFVCVGAEEGVELHDKNMSFDTFPWNDPFLVVGAVCGAESAPDRFMVKSGPALSRESSSMGWDLEIFKIGNGYWQSAEASLSGKRQVNKKGSKEEVTSTFIPCPPGAAGSADCRGTAK